MPAPPAKVGAEARQETEAQGGGTAYVCHSEAWGHEHGLKSIGSIWRKKTDGKKKTKFQGRIFFRLKNLILPPGGFLEEAPETGRWWENREAVSHQGGGQRFENAESKLGCHSGQESPALRLRRAVVKPPQRWQPDPKPLHCQSILQPQAQPSNAGWGLLSRAWQGRDPLGSVPGCRGYQVKALSRQNAGPPSGLQI